MDDGERRPQFKNVVVFVKSIESAKAFYMEYLGEEIEFDFGTNVCFKSGLSLWELREALPIRKALGTQLGTEQSGVRLELYYETGDLDAFVNRIQPLGLQLLHPIQEEPWGQRTFRFFDRDHHLVEVGETMAAFISRLHARGLSVVQISEKTMIPAEVIETHIEQ